MSSAVPSVSKAMCPLQMPLFFFILLQLKNIVTVSILLLGIFVQKVLQKNRKLRWGDIWLILCDRQ